MSRTNNISAIDALSTFLDTLRDLQYTPEEVKAAIVYFSTSPGGDVGADKISPRHCGHPNHPGCDDCTPQDAAPAVAGEPPIYVWKDGYDVGRKGGINAPDLHPATADLVMRFTDALRHKLAAAEVKYGYSDGWLSPDWMDECRASLLEHIAKGDPRDVAAYCMFLWHHGESTATPSMVQPAPVKVDEDARPFAKLRFFRDLTEQQRLDLLARFGAIPPGAESEVRSHATEALLFQFAWNSPRRHEFAQAIDDAIASTPATHTGAPS